MPTDPYVPDALDEEPRQARNLAPGVQMPPALAWRADRPGDLGAEQPEGALLGSPGPNVGYALTLANRQRGRLRLAPHEHTQDAVAVVAALAMKRAAAFGRAPVKPDVDLAVELLGYAGEVPTAVTARRAVATHGAAHEYAVCRTLVDAVPVELLRLAPAELASQAPAVRDAMLRASAQRSAAD